MRGRAGLSSLALVAGVVLATLVVPAARAALPAGLPPDTSTITPEQLRVLQEFMRDPQGNRADLFALGRQGPHTLPVLVLLALGDAHLRAGHLRSARTMFTEVVAREPGAQWTGFAHLGMGWVGMVTGQYDDARAHYAQVPADGENGAIAQLMLAWLAAASGQPAQADALFARLAADGNLPPYVLGVARLGHGYARYWMRDYRGAAALFDDVATTSPPTLLSDDARYAAAWSRYRAGDERAAVDALVQLAGATASPAPSPPVSSALLDLEPRAVLRAGRWHSARAASAPTVEARLEVLFDGDGRTLARAALRRILRESETAPAAIPSALQAELARDVDVPRAPLDPTPDAARPAGPPAAPRSPDPVPIRPSPATAFGVVLRMVIGVALLAALVFVAWRLRGDARTSRR